jgi:hypothetical protein
VFVGFDNRRDFADLLRMELKIAYIPPVSVATFFLLLPGPQSASGEVMKILAVPDLGQTLWSWMWNYGSFLEVVYTSTLAQAPTSLTSCITFHQNNQLSVCQVLFPFILLIALKLKIPH